jgi:hypothetical protein
MGRLAHFFLDVDMRLSHQGLWDYIKKKRIKVEQDDFVVFMNRKRNMVKMFCGGKEAIFSYKKDDRALDPGIIPLLPKYCGGSAMDVDGAVKEHLLKLLNKRKKRGKKDAYQGTYV